VFWTAIAFRTWAARTDSRRAQSGITQTRVTVEHWSNRISRMYACFEPIQELKSAPSTHGHHKRAPTLMRGLRVWRDGGTEGRG